jgi:hypothetical protein
LQEIHTIAYKASDPFKAVYKDCADTRARLVLKIGFLDAEGSLPDNNGIVRGQPRVQLTTYPSCSCAHKGLETLMLRQKINDKEGIPIGQQRMIYGGKELSDENLTLEDCRINHSLGSQAAMTCNEAT